MTSLLVEWVNDELQLEPPLTEETLAEELGSGFILGALLHRHNQLAEHERLRRRDTAEDIDSWADLQQAQLLQRRLLQGSVKATVANTLQRIEV